MGRVGERPRARWARRTRGHLVEHGKDAGDVADAAHLEPEPAIRLQQAVDVVEQPRVVGDGHPVHGGTAHHHVERSAGREQLGEPLHRSFDERLVGRPARSAPPPAATVGGRGRRPHRRVPRRRRRAVKSPAPHPRSSTRWSGEAGARPGTSRRTRGGGRCWPHRARRPRPAARPADPASPARGRPHRQPRKRPFAPAVSFDEMTFSSLRRCSSRGLSSRTGGEVAGGQPDGSNWSGNARGRRPRRRAASSSLDRLRRGRPAPPRPLARAPAWRAAPWHRAHRGAGRHPVVHSTAADRAGRAEPRPPRSRRSISWDGGAAPPSAGRSPGRSRPAATSTSTLTHRRAAARHRADRQLLVAGTPTLRTTSTSRGARGPGPPRPRPPHRPGAGPARRRRRGLAGPRAAARRIPASYRSREGGCGHPPHGAPAGRP